MIIIIVGLLSIIAAWIGWMASKSTPVISDASKKSRWKIVHYPLSGKYFVLLDGKYLQRNYATGIIEQLDDCVWQYANSFSSEKDCMEFIETAKEQIMKVNVREIEV